jgi:DNA-binding transcriptional MerR regulator
MSITQTGFLDGAAPFPTRIAKGPRRTMLIGKLARLTGRTVHTIRWYESQRLIPGVRRDLQGRRLYAEWHVDWLELLDRLRGSGMSIRALREYTTFAKRGVATVEDCQRLLQTHREHIEATIAELNESLALIDAKIAFYSEWRRTGVRPPPLPHRRSTGGPTEQAD